MEQKVNELANFVGLVPGNQVIVSAELPPDETKPTTLRFLAEPVDGSVTLVQHGRRIGTHLSSAELLMALHTGIRNASSFNADGAQITVMHADRIVAQDAVDAWTAHPHFSVSPNAIVVGAGILILLLLVVWWWGTA